MTVTCDGNILCVTIKMSTLVWYCTIVFKILHEGLQKNQERRKTEAEGGSEGENVECLVSASLGSHGRHSWTAVLARVQ